MGLLQARLMRKLHEVVCLLVAAKLIYLCNARVIHDAGDKHAVAGVHRDLRAFTLAGLWGRYKRC